MVFRLEGEELEAFNASVRSELEDKAREKGLAEGRAKGREEGRTEGRAEGIEQNKEENAHKMIEKGYPLKDIEEITGISSKILESWIAKQ